jgi:DNA-binding CsgD family transcriptional regulator
VASTEELNYLLDALGQSKSLQLQNSAGLSQLTAREQEVTLLLAEGMTNRDIAQALHVTEHTVSNYLYRIFDRFGVSSRVELILIRAEPQSVRQFPTARIEHGIKLALRKVPSQNALRYPAQTEKVPRRFFGARHCVEPRRSTARLPSQPPSFRIAPIAWPVQTAYPFITPPLISHCWSF